MGPDARKNLRNVAIIVLLAVIVWLVPGGARAGITVSNLLGLIFAAGFVFFGYRFYMEHRDEILSLEDRQRGILYASLALIAISLIGTSRMWQTAGGGLLWLGLIGIGCWGIYSVFRAMRAY